MPNKSCTSSPTKGSYTFLFSFSSSALLDSSNLCFPNLSSISLSLAAVSTGLAAPKMEAFFSGAPPGFLGPSFSTGLVLGWRFNLGRSTGASFQNTGWQFFFLYCYRIKFLKIRWSVYAYCTSNNINYVDVNCTIYMPASSFSFLAYHILSRWF